MIDDAELDAMLAMYRALMSLPEAARRRALLYVASRSVDNRVIVEVDRILAGERERKRVRETG